MGVTGRLDQSRMYMCRVGRLTQVYTHPPTHTPLYNKTKHTRGGDSMLPFLSKSSCSLMTVQEDHGEQSGRSLLTKWGQLHDSREDGIYLWLKCAVWKVQGSCHEFRKQECREPCRSSATCSDGLPWTANSSLHTCVANVGSVYVSWIILLWLPRWCPRWRKWHYKRSPQCYQWCWSSPCSQLSHKKTRI